MSKNGMITAGCAVVYRRILRFARVALVAWVCFSFCVEVKTVDVSVELFHDTIL